MITFLAAVSALCHLAFILVYGSLRWEETPEGVNTMLGSMAFFGLSLTIVLLGVVPLPLWVALAAASLLLTAAVGVSRTLLVVRRQKEAAEKLKERPPLPG